MKEKKENNSSVLTSKESVTKLHEVDASPFTIVEVDGDFRLAVGKNIASIKVYKSKEEAEEEVKGFNWELLINVACIAMQSMMKNV